MSRARFYDLFATYRGPSPHWQMGGKPRVRGCDRDRYGNLEPPLPDWRVKALSVTQACLFVRTSATSASRDDRLGVWSWSLAEGERGP